MSSEPEEIAIKGYFLALMQYTPDRLGACVALNTCTSADVPAAVKTVFRVLLWNITAGMISWP